MRRKSLAGNSRIQGLKSTWKAWNKQEATSSLIQARGRWECAGGRFYLLCSVIFMAVWKLLLQCLIPKPHNAGRLRKHLLSRIEFTDISISSTCAFSMSHYNNPERRIIFLIWPKWKLSPGRVMCSGLHSLGAAMLRFMQGLIFCEAPTLAHYGHIFYRTKSDWAPCRQT